MSERVRAALETIARLADLRPEELRPEMDLMVDLGIDSPKALELLIEIEEKLGLVISDEDAAELDTVGDILDYVERSGSASPA